MLGCGITCLVTFLSANENKFKNVHIEKKCLFIESEWCENETNERDRFLGSVNVYVKDVLLT